MTYDIRLAEVRRHGVPGPLTRFGTAKAKEARALHETLPGYAPTPLRALPALSKVLGIAGMYVKDESFRFGLNAFKGLGAGFAVHCVAREHPGTLTFITATDGNHGRGVAWAAASLGHRARVYLPKGTVTERLENIRALGAYAEITELSYDDTVRYAARLAAEHHWILIQDTSWEGYEEIPALIMQGYSTMGLEITEQLNGVRPTHVFLQAGVGAMAGAMTAFFADYYGANRPKIILVEPQGADCIFRTVQADDGALHFCGEDMQTMMAGLCCGEPCPLAYEILRDYADFALACPDETSADGMRILGLPLENDPVIISGESGAVTAGAAAEILRDADPSLRNALGLSPESVILCISTEGDTDRQNYQRIVHPASAAL